MSKLLSIMERTWAHVRHEQNMGQRNQNKKGALFQGPFSVWRRQDLNLRPPFGGYEPLLIVVQFCPK